MIGKRHLCRVSYSRLLSPTRFPFYKNVMSKTGNTTDWNSVTFHKNTGSMGFTIRTLFPWL